MSGTVMKFGPQWIRTLTDGGAPASTAHMNNTSSNSNSQHQQTSSANNSSNNNNSTNTNINLQNNSSSNSNGGGKYKLAEYRYGREEMLALYEHDIEAPEDIRKFTDLYVEKAHVPMAMTQMSEEELKLSTRNWNSEAVLRSSTGKMAAAAAAAGSLGGSGPSLAGGLQGSAATSGIGSNLSDRDTRQSERGASGAMSAAGVLSSSPRGPPGSLSRIPIEQRGLLTSMNTRGPTSIRHLVGRSGPSMYNRSQSHEDEGADDASGAALGTSFENRFGIAGQARQPNSLRARFETNRTTSGASSTKPIDIKNNGTIESESSGERRSVFDRLPNKYSLEDKIPRKDINGRLIPGGDWRSRDWSGGGGSDARDPKMTTDERSWRSARGGTGEDWRSNNSSNASSSWYVKTDEQRRVGGLNQDNLTSSVFSKRDTLRRPSTDEKQGDDDEPTQPRHRRDSLPEWSIGDPLSGDKVGSFDASGAFREVARDEGIDLNNKDKNHDPSGFESKSSGISNEQEWRAKQGHAPNSYNMNDPRNFNGVDSQTLSELEKLTLSDRNNIPGRDRTKISTASEESRSRPSHRSPPSPTDIECKKLAGSNSAMNERHQQQTNQNDDDGFAHLERAAECMVAQWTAEEEQDSQMYTVNKSNLNAKQQDAQAEQVASKSFDPNDQKKLLLPFNHEDSQQWFYRDTQGVVQGPFSANEMFEWYKAGYFVKELLIRRACDEVFCQLGEVIKMWDRIPFAPVPVNVPPPHPITPQAILQFRAVTKQLELASGMNPSQGQIPPSAFGIPHPGAVLMLQQQQQVHQVLAAASLNQNISNPQEQQAGIRQIFEASRQHDQSMAQQRSHPALDQNEMQTQLRQLLAQLKSREGFSNLNAQEQQEVLVRQFVASRTMPGNMQDQEQQALLQSSTAMPFLPFFSSNEERMRYQQRMEMERRQKEESENQDRFVMERMKAEEEKQRIMDEMQNRQRQKQKEESDKQRQEAERILKLSQLKQLQLAKQQEEFRQQQLQNQQKIQQQQQAQAQQQQQQEKKHRQQVNQMNAIQQQQQQEQQQIERAKKAAQAQQVHQEQQRKTAWSTVSKPDQEPISLATLQKMQEEEKEKERERQRQIQQQIQRQMTWANAAQQSKAAPVKTLAEIQKEEEERLAREKQKKPKVQAAVPNAGVWNNAASHLSWKNPPADS